MPKRLFQAAVAAALIFTMGAHWAILQSVAWVGMFAKFSQSCSVTEAFLKTFNGTNPCKLCIVVQEGKKSEQKQLTIKLETKLDLFLLDRNTLWLRPGFASLDLALPFSDLAFARSERPPTPPPRFA